MCMPPLRTPSGLPALGGNPAGLCSSPSPSTSPSSTSNSLDSLGTVEEAGTPTTERRPDAAAQPPRPPQWPCPEGDDGCAHLPAARLEVRRGDGVGRAWRVLTQGARGGYVLLEQVRPARASERASGVVEASTGREGKGAIARACVPSWLGAWGISTLPHAHMDVRTSPLPPAA